MTIAEKIVRTALAKGELDKLLLGAPEYQYRSRFSPAPGNTDIIELLAEIYCGLDANEMQMARESLSGALHSLVKSYEGIGPVASCVLYEASHKARGISTLDLPLEEIGKELRESVENFKTRLYADKTGAGHGWPDGMFGELRRLSSITEKYGGPSFCK